MISLTSVQSCVSCVYCMSLLLIVFIVAPMQQHTVESKDHTSTYLDAKHRAALEKLRDVAQALAVVLGILVDLRETGRAVEKCESFGSEGLARVSCMRVHRLTACLTITTTSTHTSRNRSAAPWRWTAGSGRK